MLCTLVNVSTEFVSPFNTESPLFHWYVGVGTPVAQTQSVAFCPRLTASPAGCTAITGTCGPKGAGVLRARTLPSPNWPLMALPAPKSIPLVFKTNV